MPQAPATKAPSRREARRLLQQDVSRTQLLDAAEEVFGRKGFHETTLKEVAELAEFSVGSVYSFFESKDDLFRQIFLRRGAEFMPGMQAGSMTAAPTRRPAPRASSTSRSGSSGQHPHFGRLYLRYSNATMLSADREIDVAMRERYEEAMRLQAALVARGQAAAVPGRRPRGAGPAVQRAHVRLPGTRPGGGVRRPRRGRAPAARRAARDHRAALVVR